MKKPNFNRLFKTTLFLIVISSLSFSFMMSCQKNDINDISEDGEAFKKSTQNANLVKTINELISIRDSIGRIAYYRKVTASELKSAYERKDTCAILQLLGMTENDIKILNSKLVFLGEELLTYNPAIKNNLTNMISSHCSSCDINSFFENYDNYIALSIKGLRPPRLKSANVEEEPSDCEWVQLSACLYLCTLTGPIAYWPCAYLCYCSYCTGGYTNYCL